MSELKEGFKEMLGGDWDYFGTFTQRFTMTEAMARRYAETLYRYAVVNGTGGGRMFWASERHKEGSYHIHALFDSGCAKAQIHKEWNRISRSKEEKEVGMSNYCRILDYDKRLGGHGYVSKYVTKGLVDWDLYKWAPDGDRKIVQKQWMHF